MLVTQNMLEIQTANNNTYVSNGAFYLFCTAPPGNYSRWFRSGTLAFDIVCLISRDKCSFRQNMDSSRFYYIKEIDTPKKSRRRRKKMKREHTRITEKKYNNTLKWQEGKKALDIHVFVFVFVCICCNKHKLNEHLIVY